MARSRKKKTTRDRLIEAALYAAPGPVRTIASNPIGFRFLLIAGAAMMAMGILTLDWQDGVPKFQFNREKAREVQQDIVKEVGTQVQTWNQNQGGVNPSGYFTQTPAQGFVQGNAAGAYPQTAQPYAPAYNDNPAAWGQPQGPANGYYYPNGVGQPNGYPPAINPYSNVPNPQQPYQQPPYFQSNNGYPGDYRR